MTIFEKTFELLFTYYGPQGWWPLLQKKGDTYRSSYSIKEPTEGRSKDEILEIAIGAILTQNTNWNNAERALVNLKKEGMLRGNKLQWINHDELGTLIKPSGYYNQKAKKIKAYMDFMASGRPINRDNLLSIWGLGPETVDDILLYGYDQPYFVVDKYTRRLFNRLGQCDMKIDYHKLQTMIQDGIDRDVYTYKEYHGLIVAHSKNQCAKTPQCGGCPLIYQCKVKTT